MSKVVTDFNQYVRFIRPTHNIIFRLPVTVTVTPVTAAAKSRVNRNPSQRMVSLSFVFVLCLVLSPTAVQSIPLRDEDAIAMKDISSIWRSPQGWIGDDPCQWKGVKCDVISEGFFFKSETVAVTSLSCRGICSSFSEKDHSKCFLPHSIGKLKYLQHLYLNGNGFLGEIPESLSDLKNLVSLYLNGNKLTGDIPSSLGSLQMLEKLYLNSNELSGTIPASLGNAKNLRQLELQQNELYGTIPEQLSKLHHLVQLDLNGWFACRHANHRPIARSLAPARVSVC